MTHDEYVKRKDEAVAAFIKDTIPPEYHAHLLDSDDNAGERLRQAIDELVLAVIGNQTAVGKVATWDDKNRRAGRNTLIDEQRSIVKGGK